MMNLLLVKSEKAIWEMYMRELGKMAIAHEVH